MRAVSKGAETRDEAGRPSWAQEMPGEVAEGFSPAGEDKRFWGQTVWGTTAANPEGPSEISSSNHPTQRGRTPKLER